MLKKHPFNFDIRFHLKYFNGHTLLAYIFKL